MPAQIVESLSSDDVTVQEGDNVTLVCHVTGVPQPEVRWRRKQTMESVTELSATADKSVVGDYSPACPLTEGQSRFHLLYIIITASSLIS